MNETIRLINSRKSVRSYQDREIMPEHRRAILEAAIQAPTPGNMCLYTILDIKEQKLLEALAVSCDDQPFIAKSKMTLIFCADYKRWYDIFRRHEPSVRKPAEGDLFLAMADAFIAAQTAALAAESLGIGSCYIGDITERYEYHRELLCLPDYVVPACMLCFGYPAAGQLSRKKPPRFEPKDIVHENRYALQKAGDMERMLEQREGLEGEALDGWIKRFCERKWNSDFSREMSRSCRELLKSWIA